MADELIVPLTFSLPAVLQQVLPFTEDKSLGVSIIRECWLLLGKNLINTSDP